MDERLDFIEEELFYEPREKALKLMNNFPNEPEMTEFESAYLSGLIRKFKPNKLLEIGIAAGATTGIIIQALLETRERNEDIKFYSIDLNKIYYREHGQSLEGKKSGFLVDIMRSNTDIWINHTCILGKTVCESFNEIDHDIDFVIIDTVHLLPGELLDLPIILKMVSRNAIIVFHDLSLQHFCWIKENNQNAFATMAALLALSGRKHIPFDLEKPTNFQNIGAIQLTENSFKDFTNLFYALNLPWSYYPNELILNGYINFYNCHYSEYGYIYKKAIDSNIRHVKFLKEQYFSKLFHNVILDLVNVKEVSIYGAGEIGNFFINLSEKNGIFIKNIFVTKIDRFVHTIKNHTVLEYKPELIQEGDVILIASEKFALEIFNYILNNLSKKIKILSILSPLNNGQKNEDHQ